MKINLTVTEEISVSTQMRLDAYVASQVANMNRSHLKSSAKEIRLNGKPSKLSAKVKAGDVIDIEYEEIVPTDIEPENIPLHIIYEDDNVTVINKEQGMVTHPAAGNWNGTLVNALLFHWKKEKISTAENGTDATTSSKLRPGIVHRLDKDTSGVIITAKNRDAEEWLSAQFRSHRIKKEYLAIVQGKPPARAGEIRTQIVRDAKDRKKFTAVTNTTAGKFARTIFHCVACYGNYSVIRLRLKTGRTHQIRVHLKYLGCPILGDPIYGKKDLLFPNAPLMLHSCLLGIALPHEKKLTVFKAEMPEHFLKIHQALRNKFERIVMSKVQCESVSHTETPYANAPKISVKRKIKK